ncbi:ubiquinone biosynthesis protein [Actinobacillus equuli]|nr:ubiquinone biosynthesis protein [Actinobacillus equuli]
MGVKAILRDLKQRAPQFREHFAEFPEAVFNALQQQKQINFRLDELNKTLQAQGQQKSRNVQSIISGLIIIGVLWRFDNLPLWVSLGLLSVALLSLFLQRK